ncbi:MAG: nuclear transport factor 2 family protein [Rhodoferax sp.]|uniref:nuclear transport factor 2 family protein n=1 Tax=Rhodoferax sp. TaxID=50421 RepID=UPI0027320DFB|nr:nuclear transport factor 2 family protein [Rhodoferax sp.]MDP1528360.1 nuclear transport factor 2 family protein [Rhodoferax sp.]
MTIRTVLIAAVSAACAVGAPIMAASAASARPVASADGHVEVANQAVVETLYRAFAAGDGPAIAALFSDDLVWIEGEGGPYADRNPYNGPAAVFGGIFGRVTSEFTGFAATPETFLPSGNRVVVLGRYTGTNVATGEVLNAQFVHIHTVADGKLIHFQQYTDTAQWIDVVTPD